MNNKFLLSAGVIGAFSLYTLHLKLDANENKPLAKVNLPPSTSSPVTKASGNYKDGIYTGDVTDAFYGNVQVKVAIAGGKINNVTFLQYPSDRQTSVMINSQATPLLSQEAIQAQSANVDGVSGATATSQAFIQSLQSALNQAS